MGANTRAKLPRAMPSFSSSLITLIMTLRLLPIMAMYRALVETAQRNTRISSRWPRVTTIRKLVSLTGRCLRGTPAPAQARPEVRHRPCPRLKLRWRGGSFCGGQRDVFVEPVLPVPGAFIFGAGHISKSLSKGGQLGRDLAGRAYVCATTAYARGSLPYPFGAATGGDGNSADRLPVDACFQRGRGGARRVTGNHGSIPNTASTGTVPPQEVVRFLL